MDKNEFIKELEKLNISIDEKKLSQLKKYYQLLVKINEKINLTGITEENQVYLKHFYDSATLVKIIDLNQEETLCDIGSGAGFPGLVLKILFPHLKVVLVDSLNKRIEFLNLVINDLNLEDIKTIHTRIEDYGILNREKFDVVTARAVAPLNVLSEYAIPLVKVDKHFIAMKANISQEIDNCKSTLKKLDSKIVKTEEFLLPFENSVRTLIKVKKNKITNSKYPRKNNEIKSKQL